MYTIHIPILQQQEQTPGGSLTAVAQSVLAQVVVFAVMDVRVRVRVRAAVFELASGRAGIRTLAAVVEGGPQSMEPVCALVQGTLAAQQEWKDWD